MSVGLLGSSWFAILANGIDTWVLLSFLNTLRDACLRFAQRTFSLSWHLVFLVVASIVPILVFASILAERYVAAERNESERQLNHAAEELADAFDTEIDSAIAVLTALAATTNVDKGDLRGFHAELGRMMESKPGWRTIILHERSGRALFSAIRPFGEEIPVAEPSSLPPVFEQAKPVVSALAPRPHGSVMNESWAFAVRVPVIRGGQVVYSLSAVVTASSLEKLIERTANQPGWIRTIADPKGRVAARSAHGEKWVGVMGPESIVRLNRENAHFYVQEKNIEGRAVYIAGHRAKVSGWSVGVSVPADLIEAPERRARLAVILVGALPLMLFALFALAYSRHLSNKISSAARAAIALAKGGKPQVEPSNVLEVEQLRTSLMTASELLSANEKRRDESLREANEARAEADRANQAKSEFLANMSHELRTPLGVVLGLSELIANGQVPDDERATMTDAIKRNGRQLLRLIDDILDLSKVEASKIVVEEVDFSLRDLLTSFVEDHRPLASGKGLTLDLHVGERVPDRVCSDPVRLRQILNNVVGNALKFTDRGGVTVEVDGVKCEGGYKISADVADTGIGIDEDQQKKLFSPFTQAESGHTRRFGGTGLGLALSRKLARLFGGDLVIAESVPGKGTRFRISFEVRAPLVPQSVSRAPARPAPDLSGKRMLLAEDSSDNVVLIKTLLRPTKIGIDVAWTGREAVEKLSKQSYDLAMMDIQMPEMDGYQAAEKIRGLGLRLPLVALTAHAQMDHKDKALSKGFTDFVTKPVRREDLIATLEKIFAV